MRFTRHPQNTPLGLFSQQELDDMPTLLEGHDADLKIDRDGYKIWLSRMDVEDFMGGPLPPSFPLEFERLVNGAWKLCDQNGDLLDN